ncbi:MAG: hypothetical protein ACYC2I_10420 [Elusimicrobiales bacterium]
MKKRFLICAAMAAVLAGGMLPASASGQAAGRHGPEKTDGRPKEELREQPDTNAQFSGDAAAADARMHSLMEELRRIKKTPLTGISAADRKKAWDDGMRRLADEIDAKLKKDRLWGKDGGLQSEGVSAYLRGDYEVAILLLTKAIEKATDPNIKTWTIKDRGEAYLAKGDRENAMKDLDAALKIKAENKGYNLAQFALKLGRQEDARRELENAIAYQKARHPGFVATWGVCSDLADSGKPVAGCITSAITECFSVYGTAAYAAADCAKYDMNMQYLASRPPGELDNLVKIQGVKP